MQTDMLGTVMDSATSGATPVDQVDELIASEADKAGLNLAET